MLFRSRFDLRHRRVRYDPAFRVGPQILAGVKSEAIEAMIEGPERRRQLLGVEVRQWHAGAAEGLQRRPLLRQAEQRSRLAIIAFQLVPADRPARMRHIVTRSEEHTSELQSLMRISYAVLCLKKKITHNKTNMYPN